jgi:hypothetical protein
LEPDDPFDRARAQSVGDAADRVLVHGRTVRRYRCRR